MRQNFRFMVERLYLGLLSLYPRRFGATFAEEIQDIFLRIADEAEETGNLELIALYFFELKNLAISVLREHWHELKSGKERKKPSENGLHAANAIQNVAALLSTVGIPDWRWVLRWTLLMTAAIPAGGLLQAPFTAFLLFIFNLGANVGILPSVSGETLAQPRRDRSHERIGLPE